MNTTDRKSENMAMVMEFLSTQEDTQDLENNEGFAEFLRDKCERYGEAWVFDNDDLLVEEFRSKLP